MEERDFYSASTQAVAGQEDSQEVLMIAIALMLNINYFNVVRLVETSCFLAFPQSFTIMRTMRQAIRTSAILFVGLVLFSFSQDSSASAPQKRILILFPYESNMPGFINFETGFRSTLAGSKDYQFEFYAECMDLTRFPNEHYYVKLMELYREKYSNLKIDLIVADRRPSLEFMAEYSPGSFRDVPVILYSQDPVLLGDPKPMPTAAVVTGRLDMAGTLALAMRLHPEVR